MLVGRYQTQTGQLKARVSSFQKCNFRASEGSSFAWALSVYFWGLLSLSPEPLGPLSVPISSCPGDSTRCGSTAHISSVQHGQLLFSPSLLLYLCGHLEASCLDMPNKVSEKGQWGTLYQKVTGLVQSHLTVLGSFWIFPVGWWQGHPKGCPADAPQKGILEATEQSLLSVWKTRCFLLTGSPRIHVPTVRMFFFWQLHSLKRMPFSNSQEERHPSASCCPDHYYKKKKRKKKRLEEKRFGSFLFNTLPDFPYGYGWQVANTMSVRLWSLLPYPNVNFSPPLSSESWGYADIHVDQHWLVIFFLLCLLLAPFLPFS